MLKTMNVKKKKALVQAVLQYQEILLSSFPEGNQKGVEGHWLSSGRRKKYKKKGKGNTLCFKFSTSSNSRVQDNFFPWIGLQKEMQKRNEMNTTNVGVKDLAPHSDLPRARTSSEITGRETRFPGSFFPLFQQEFFHVSISQFMNLYIIKGDLLTKIKHQHQ